MSNKVLALVETAANQHYVFETNRLRDTIGASEHVAALVPDAAMHALPADVSALLRASGLVEAVFDDSATARTWISRVTLAVLQAAPGLDIAGAFVPLANDLTEARKAVREELGKARGRRPGPLTRQATLPWCQPCDYTGQPASDVKNPNRGEHLAGRRASASVVARRTHAVVNAARTRIKRSLADAGCSGRLVKNIDDAIDETGIADEGLSKEGDWRAVVHADVNRLGKLFLDFDRVVARLQPGGEGNDIASHLQTFSTALERAAWRSLAAAINSVGSHIDALTSGDSTEGLRTLPIYPLLVGGDDVTVVCDGQYAVLLAERYLSAFEAESASGDLAPYVAAASAAGVLTGDRLRACAGIAIFKPHFPFSIAYQFANDLCDNAKDATSDIDSSALDWHVIYDASPPDLASVRAAWMTTTESTSKPLTCRPFSAGEPAVAGAKGIQSVHDAARAADLLSATHDERRTIPRSIVHELRTSLAKGEEEATRVFRMLMKDHPSIGRVLRALGAQEDSPFDARGRCGLIDAMEGVEFLRGVQFLKGVQA